MFPESHSHAFAATAHQGGLAEAIPSHRVLCLAYELPADGLFSNGNRQAGRAFARLRQLLKPVHKPQRGAPHLRKRRARLGLRLIKHVGAALAESIIAERERHGPYISASDFAHRACPKLDALESLVLAGALDDVSPTAARHCGRRDCCPPQSAERK